jgi:hypothetical protein
MGIFFANSFPNKKFSHKIRIPNYEKTNEQNIINKKTDF